MEISLVQFCWGYPVSVSWRLYDFHPCFVLTQTDCWMLQHKLHFCDLPGQPVLCHSQYPIFCKYDHNSQWYNWNRISLLYTYTQGVLGRIYYPCLSLIFQCMWWGWQKQEINDNTIFWSISVHNFHNSVITLNLLYITQRFCTITMFVIFYISEMFHIELLLSSWAVSIKSSKEFYEMPWSG